ncbi:MAG: 3-isopropylmalate dehydratase small subunit [Actinomycetota bacterium]|nr:3-isopropylmalate dehydratase small subunit [Actinomycetota bacterium]
MVLRRNDVDTDQIIPAEYCKRLTKSGYQDTLFAEWRKDPTFVLNHPERSGATILVSGRNFGTGSSREHAVWALRDWGFAVVIAISFGDIFRRNAVNNGVLVLELPEPAVAELADRVDADPCVEITADLVNLEVRTGELRHPFTMDQRSRWLLLEGLDEIAITLGKDAAVSAYEQARRPWLPSIRPTPPRPAHNLVVKGRP